MKTYLYLFLIAIGFGGLLSACGSSELQTPTIAGPAFVLFYTDN